MLKALSYVLPEPGESLQPLERNGNFIANPAYLEDSKTLPFGAVWDEYRLRQEVPVGRRWLEIVNMYEKQVLATRD